MLETISSMDEHENYYHGLAAGLLTGIKGYITKSNRERQVQPFRKAGIKAEGSLYCRI